MPAPLSRNPLGKTLKIRFGLRKIARLPSVSVNKPAHVKRTEIFRICFKFSFYFFKRRVEFSLDKINPAKLIVPPKNLRINAKRFFVCLFCAREIIRTTVKIIVPELHEKFRILRCKDKRRSRGVILLPREAREQIPGK